MFETTLTFTLSVVHKKLLSGFDHLLLEHFHWSILWIASNVSIRRSREWCIHQIYERTLFVSLCEQHRVKHKRYSTVVLSMLLNSFAFFCPVYQNFTCNVFLISTHFSPSETQFFNCLVLTRYRNLNKKTSKYFK